jgi:hypothetical protein
MTIADLVEAQAKLTAFIASMFNRTGVVSTVEFAALLSMFAVVVGETEPEQGEILALWAATVRAVEDDAAAP